MVLVALLLLGVSVLLAMALTDPSMTVENYSHDKTVFMLVTVLINQVFSILIFFLLYKLTRSLGTEATPFTSDNVRLLKQMAVLFFAGWVLVLAIEAILAYVLSIPIEGVSADALVMAGVIYVISLVFEYGVRLQEESDGFV